MHAAFDSAASLRLVQDHWGSGGVGVSVTASHFKNHMMAALEKSLGVDGRFSVPNSPWSNGICERMIREVVRKLKAMIQKEKRNIQDWVELVPPLA